MGLIKVFKLFSRKSLKQDDLPYGWEEASLSDGRVYFIDHHTHTTSWTDPRKLIANAQNSASSCKLYSNNVSSNRT